MPRPARRLAVLAALALALWLAPEAAAGKGRADNVWSRARKPSGGPARSIGAYRAGCLAGARALPPRGPGYRMLGGRRRRHFGHPTLLDFVRRLGARAWAAGLAPIEVGDLAQPRGGPAPPIHASHQTGLDVDIYYVPGGPPPRLPHAARRPPHRVRALLKLAAADPRVTRILVNPRIKRTLCREVDGDRSWLGKLEPWWGHRRHFHVQLGCPAESGECVSRPPRPPGDGCDQVAWWFDPGKRSERHRRHAEYRGWIARPAALPASCRRLEPHVRRARARGRGRAPAQAHASRLSRRNR